MITTLVYLVPHQITLMVDEHRGHRTDMLVAFEEAGKALREVEPEAVVFLNARWQPASPWLVDTSKRHRTLTDYSGFGVEVRHDCPGDQELGRSLVRAGEKAGLRVAGTQRGVDSGLTVPLHFLALPREMPIVPLSVSGFDAATCRRWGEILRETLEAYPKRVAFVVAGMLSNDEHAWKLRRNVPESGEFDEAALHALQEGAWDRMPHGKRLMKRAKPQAELRHFEVLRGFLGTDAKGQVHCYESGHGVGSAIVQFDATLPSDAIAAPGDD